MVCNNYIDSFSSCLKIVSNRLVYFYKNCNKIEDGDHFEDTRHPMIL